ncbi:MAG: hypothetical protein A2233_00525 [Candidatus Kerfeldbacteria bacterium RIFOXYA2_FULL_38_24]|uniref:Uncharacterized protein n=1 Tax=Candidatus Kerfeldbacteria bacterium RIFOXYB2_FULL_38_14 TaxID=1798547 RepID=A0A1G2BC85_9BACT|nr:MAG: hypothetical protein A2233_00525 [Candidatus Kerfeldbacteria bacterium RIFOXYA2_FULL_38_24]OGY86645.1 MAG: hypothetical protein A2319_02815 [Candidatus Kerfeldbacteria bacterium RIFOXYB2_FULL_38_14]
MLTKKITFSLVIITSLFIIVHSAQAATSSHNYTKQALKLLKQEQSFAHIKKIEKQLKVVSVDTSDPLGIVHVQFRQRYPKRNITVYGSGLGVHFDKKGNLLRISGSIEKDLSSLKSYPKIKVTKALKVSKKIIKTLGIKKYKLKKNLVFLSSKLINADTAKLSWHFVFYKNNLKKFRWHIFIDAQTGKVLLKYNEIYNGTGDGYYATEANFNTHHISDDSADYYLMEDVDKQLLTHDDNYTYEASDDEMYKDNDDVWGKDNTDQKPAVDAHYFASIVYDYYNDKFAVPNVYNHDGKTKIYVHAEDNNIAYGALSSNTDTAWVMGFGDGDNTNYSSLATLDITAHEMAHGVTHYAGGLVYAGESGAMNEAYSDIFAANVEYYAQQQGLNDDANIWWMGEDAYTPNQAGDATRYMDHPTEAPNYVDHYSQYDMGTYLHYNSGVISNMYYLLANGGYNDTSGLTVGSIGIEKSEQIVYRALRYYLSPDAQFIDMYYAMLWAAQDLYDNQQYNITLDDIENIKQAWQAVGVTSEFTLDDTYVYGDDKIIIKQGATYEVPAQYTWPIDGSGSYEWFATFPKRYARILSVGFDQSKTYPTAKNTPITTTISLSAARSNFSTNIDIGANIDYDDNNYSETISKKYELISNKTIPYGTAILPSTIGFVGQEMRLRGVNLDKVTSITIGSQSITNFTLDYTNNDYPEIVFTLPNASYDGEITLNGKTVVDDDVSFNTVSSIQEAINLAKDNDEIFIPAGVYRENLVITQKTITLKGEAGTILMSPQKTSIQLSDCPEVTIEGITFDSSELTGNNVEFIGKAGMSGILNLTNNTFLVNSDNTFSRKLLNLEAKKLNLSRNTFYDDTANLSSAYAIYVFGEYITVINNIFQLTNYTSVIYYSDGTSNFQDGAFINNTFKNLSSTAIKNVLELWFNQSDGMVSNLDIANNIMSGPITKGVAITFNKSIINYIEINIFNNVFYQVTDIYYTRSTPTEINDIDSVYANPLLDATGHLTSTSPAIDTGADVTSFGVTDDIDGQKRPNDNYYDIGADELYD